MSSYPNQEILNLVKELVPKLRIFNEGTNLFNHVEDYILNRIQNADSMVFLTKKEIDRTVSSLSDKFNFHGFSEQANDLQRNYENFLPQSTPKNECETRLNIMKFLLCLSESPTNNFLFNPNRTTLTQHEDEIDWPAFLKEGIERWSPAPTELSEEWSDDLRSEISYSENCDVNDSANKIITVIEGESSDDTDRSYSESKDILHESVQHGWFNQDKFVMIPESTNIDANIAIHWDDFLEYSVKGLINLERSSIITEYYVIREVLWQCWIPHNGPVFHFVGNKLLPKENMTISSVRPTVCFSFLHEFLPYIDLLDEFRNFDKNINEEKAPDTYRSYNSSIWNFMNPILKNLVNLEQEIVKQECTMTLLILANRFKYIFKTALILKDIHENVILDVEKNDILTCVSHLLSRLHGGLLHCVSKTELDIYLTLYLESLYKYFRIIDVWLSNDIIMDENDEFIIKNVHIDINTDEINTTYAIEGLDTINDERCDRDMGFVIKELDQFCEDDSVVKIICVDVLKIGKNIHFLRLLKRLHLLGNVSEKAPLHEELINKVLKELSSYFDYREIEEIYENDTNDEIKYKFPAICPDYCKYPTEMDRLENLVDTTDGFLMAAFKDFFVEQSKVVHETKETLYERISKRTNNMYPAKLIVDRVFTQILRERYNESGVLVKNVLVVDFQLRKHFKLLNHLFLFKDDLIFPLYRKLFEQIIHHQRFDNDIWLTTQLHDIMMDPYPALFEKCILKADNQSQLSQNPLISCEMIDVCYFIDWPVNFIIRDEHLLMYSELFHMILKVKWALYTLNHLYFNELEQLPLKAKHTKIAEFFLRRLKVFRFRLLNELSNIQHYMLGYVFSKSLKKFKEDFEKADNLDLLLSSHSNFISSLYSTLVYLRDFNKMYGFNMILYVVRKLQIMWEDPENIQEEKLAKYEETFKKCVENLENLIFPKDLLEV